MQYKHNVCVCMHVCVCVHVILDHDDMNAREELIWIVVIETTKMSIHILRVMFIFMGKEV